MVLTRDQVKHVAKLANLPLSEDEEEKYTKQLSKILEYIDTLNSVNTKDIDPTFNVSGKTNVMSEDRVSTALTQEEALVNAPKKRNGSIITKGVFSSE